MKVQVTADDIKNGKRNTGSACPISLACQRVFKKPVWAYPSEIYVEEEEDGKETVYDTPEACAIFMHLFDEGCNVESFEFELGDPQQ